MKSVYKKYKFGNVNRVKGPGLDIGILCKCAGCYALYLNLAYEEGRKSVKAKLDLDLIADAGEPLAVSSRHCELCGYPCEWKGKRHPDCTCKHSASSHAGLREFVNRDTVVDRECFWSYNCGCKRYKP